ncbi:MULTISPECIES: hypothetical protein [Acidithiobacillus]|nr:hypothetical protein [Acidithiobacillus ferrivorans]
MGYMIEDEEHDALEQVPFDARWMYMSLRKKMDFATGIVGGPKRRISWAEVAGMVALEHQQGRKAIPADVSRARRLMASLEKCGAVERHTSSKDRYLVLYLPLARSDKSEAAKRQEQSYQSSLAEAVEETQNCVGMDIYRARRSVSAGTADTTLQMTQPAPTASDGYGRPSPLGHPAATDLPASAWRSFDQMGLTPASEVRQTSDRPVQTKSDRPIEPASDCLNEGNLTACEEVRQTSDRPVQTKSDRHVTNPFTPNLYINLDIPTAREPAPAHIHAGAASVVQALPEAPESHQPGRSGRIRGAVRETFPDPKPATTQARSMVSLAGGVNPKTGQSAPPEEPRNRVRQNLDSRLVTVAVDDDSGVSVQVSPAFAAKHPDRLRELREIFAACAAGEVPPEFEPLPADCPAGLSDGHERGLQ